jgi:hypothetical protein
LEKATTALLDFLTKLDAKDLIAKTHSIQLHIGFLDCTNFRRMKFFRLYVALRALSCSFPSPLRNPFNHENVCFFVKDPENDYRETLERIGNIKEVRIPFLCPFFSQM